MDSRNEGFAAEHGTASSPSICSGHPANSRKRRTLLGVLLAAATGAIGATLSVPLVRFASFPLEAAPDEASWSDVGSLEEFRSLSAPMPRTIRVGHVDGWQRSATEYGVYVVPAGDGQLKVLSSVCPHLGCTVRWRSERNRFICPCHGGTFDGEGIHLAGPPRRAMDELESKIESDRLKVRFQRYQQLIAEKVPIG